MRKTICVFLLMLVSVAGAADQAPVFPYGAVYFRKSNPPREDWERDYKTAAELGVNVMRHWFMWAVIGRTKRYQGRHWRNIQHRTGMDGRTMPGRTYGLRHQFSFISLHERQQRDERYQYVPG